jgi:predicted O-linked N-acetylglucosamine transferase (SPINDLY family)
MLNLAVALDEAAALLEQGDAPAAIARLEALPAAEGDELRRHDLLAAAYSSVQRDDLALPHYQRLAEAKAANPLRRCDLALCLENLGRREEAEAALEQALARDPDCAAAWAIRPQLALWRTAPSAAAQAEGIARCQARLAETLAWFEAAPNIRRAALQQAMPAQRLFAAAYWPGDITALLAARGALAAALFPAAPLPPRDTSRRRLRLGVFSRMFFRQSVFYVLLAGLIDRLDRSRFELVLFSESTSQDDLTAWARAKADRYYPRRRDWVPTLQTAACDILYYPDTGMDPMSQWLAMQRLAPLQATSWGHPVSSGLASVDLFFSGEALEPPGAEAHYCERLVRLPGTGALTPRFELVPGELPAAVQRLVSAGRPVAVVPAMNFKLAPADDGLWVAIARRHPELCLVFFRQPQFGLSGEGNLARIGRAFAQAGLEFDRHALVLEHLPEGAFHALLAAADLYLDVPSFSGYTTAMQGAFAGLPIVTCKGRFLRQRLAAGLLRRIGCAETVAQTTEAYLAIVARLLDERRQRPADFAARRAALQAAAPQACNDERVIRAMENTMIDYLAEQGHPLARAMRAEDAASRATTLPPGGTPAAAVKTFLHVGCGHKRKDKTTRGFNTDAWRELRLDIDPKAQPDIVASMLDMRAVADGAVDALFSSHNLEHLYAHEVPVALREFLRVLKPDGFAVITCPDVQAVCALVAHGKLLEPCYTSPAGPIAPIDILWGHRASLAAGNLFMAHKVGFTQQSLTQLLIEAGFATVAMRRRGAPHFDLWAVASKAARREEEMRQLAAAHLPQGG